MTWSVAKSKYRRGRVGQKYAVALREIESTEESNAYGKGVYIGRE